MTIPVRVLILEDRQPDAELALHELRREGFEPLARRVDTREDFIAALDQDVDIILADYSLPQFDALQALRLLNQRSINAPVIILTGSISEEAAVQCMREGASDYLIKDRLARLGSAVNQALEQKKLRQEKIETEKALLRSEALNRAVLSSLTARIAVLDHKGEIITVNEAWERHASQEAEGDLCRTGIGANYLEAWRNANGQGDGTAHQALAGIQSVLDGTRKVFSMEYPCPSASATNWYSMVVTPLAESAGGAVISHTDITERKLRERVQEAIVAVSDAMRNARTRDEIIPILLEQLMGGLKTRGAAFAQYDPATGQSWLEFTRGCYLEKSGLRLPRGQGLTRQVLNGGQLVQRLPGENGPGPFGDGGENSRFVQCGLPLSAQGESLGVIWLAHDLPLPPEEIQIFKSVGELAANAIYRATLHEETERRLQRITSLREIEKAITSSLDVHVTLSVLVDEVTDQLSMDAADVFLVNPNTKSLEFAASHGFRRPPDRTTRLPGQGYAYRAMLERRTISIPNIREDHNTGSLLSLGENFVAYFAVPLIAKGQVQGVLEVFNRNIFYPNPEWLDFLETLAGQAAIAIDNAELFENLQRSNINLSLAYDNTIEGWSRALDLRDRETEGHTQRVTEMTLRLAGAVGIRDSDMLYLRWGALLHDIGKVGIPDAILLKPDSLTEEEWAIIRKHPDYAYEVLHPIAFLRPALDIPYCHHELWNGSGYPRGLKGEEIPLAARLFTIIDVYDALISHRPYRQAWSKEQVMRYIQEQSGVMFDPQVVKIFLANLR
jgi:putative nucleotidyltransferase with HDIG domain